MTPPAEVGVRRSPPGSVQPMVREHAVVIGASIAGMCAARVLSDHYAKVTVFERDDLPDQPANRPAVPQGKHVHLLMARGAAEFEALFPGLLDDMVAAGVPVLENRPDCIHFGAAGHVLGTQATLRDEFTVEVGIGYATHQIRIPDGLIEEKVIVAGACHDHPLGLGMLFYEDGNWRLTTYGTAKVEPPQNFPQMCALADQILPAHISAAVRKGEPIGDVAFHKYPTSRWRRYDKMDRFPTGIIPFGDAVVSFNPTFGQGMTMSSIQAGNLGEVLRSGDPDIAGKLAQATAKTTWPVWMMTAIGDLSLHNATGEARWWFRPVGDLFDQFLGAAETDPVLAEWFLRRFSLLDSLYMVPSARLVGRTIRHNMRLWLAERRAEGLPTAVSAPTG